ncbi:hypothetical protein [Streptomyces sp. NPDC058955]|uniref:hypothetical protein n=1 Tax=unclassified Streptomyces TaxID=2593676 RepID=UPI003664DE80
MLPDRLLWCDPRPIPRFNRQEPVTTVIWDPGFYEPTDEDDCTVFSFFCQAHDRFYRHEACAEGPHLVALYCQEHGLENSWPQQITLWFPEGFDPPLTDAQLAWLKEQ